MKHEPKEIMLRDSMWICNLTRKNRKKSAESYLLKAIGLFLFYAFTLYAILCPPAHKFYEWVDRINPVYIIVFCFVGLGSFGIWWLLKKSK